MKRMRTTIGLIALLSMVPGAFVTFGCGKEAGVNTDNSPPSKTTDDEGKKQAAGQEQLHKQQPPPGQSGQ